MKTKKKCGECGGSSIFTTRIPSGGGSAPDLLPGAHAWWGGGKLEIYICTTCGHLQYFVPTEALPKVRASKSFQPIS